MQTQPSATASAPLLYTSTLQTLGKIVKEEGVLRLWKGFSAYFVRGGGHTVAMFLFYEQYKSAARRFWLPNDN
jgi:solute carrier family 25 oxoglutarate transporter 11